LLSLDVTRFFPKSELRSPAYLTQATVRGKEYEMGEAADVLVRELKAVNERDGRTIAASFTAECIKLVPGARLHGGEQVAAWCSGLFEAFPDFKVTVTRVVENGPYASVSGIVTGTHDGNLRTPNGDIPPTGRHAELPFSETAEVRDGAMVSVQLYFDRLELLEQLGIVPAPASA
jgi:predicted ester cyclase